MHVEFTKVLCPECTGVLDLHIMHFSTYLGSPATICSWCHAEVPSGRMEWTDFPASGKVIVVGISLVYTVIVGFLGGYSYGFCEGYWLRDPSLLHGIPDFTGPDFLTGFSLWAGAVVLLQIYRIAASIRRGRSNDPRPSRGFLDLQMLLQLKIIMLLFIIPFGFWLTSLASQTLR